jgi:enoyl-CoA hydratase
MVRDLMKVLSAWAEDPRVLLVAIRGSNKEGVFGAFCAGGDIRFLHQAATENHPDLDAFFAEEYALNYLIHNYPKPYIAFMDGIVMGGGMGISQGASIRIVTERTKMAMPETLIGLFPDVGGGFFLSGCPGRVGEWLALTGQSIGASEALSFDLADQFLPSDRQAAVWEALGKSDWGTEEALYAWLGQQFSTPPDLPQGLPSSDELEARIEPYFSLPTALDVVHALEAADSGWAKETAALLRKRSPLMLEVVLQQIRRARAMTLAEDLRMELDLVHHCFHLRPGQSETVEGIRALAVDKDHQPRWNPAQVEEVSAELVQAFFKSPWEGQAHPLSHLD